MRGESGRGYGFAAGTGPTLRSSGLREFFVVDDKGECALPHSPGAAGRRPPGCCVTGLCSVPRPVYFTRGRASRGSGGGRSMASRYAAFTVPIGSNAPCRARRTAAATGFGVARDDSVTSRGRRVLRQGRTSRRHDRGIRQPLLPSVLGQAVGLSSGLPLEWADRRTD